MGSPRSATGLRSPGGRDLARVLRGRRPAGRRSCTRSAIGRRAEPTTSSWPSFPATSGAGTPTTSWGACARARRMAGPTDVPALPDEVDGAGVHARQLGPARRARGSPLLGQRPEMFDLLGAGSAPSVPTRPRCAARGTGASLSAASGLAGDSRSSGGPRAPPRPRQRDRRRAARGRRGGCGRGAGARLSISSVTISALSHARAARLGLVACPASTMRPGLASLASARVHVLPDDHLVEVASGDPTELTHVLVAPVASGRDHGDAQVRRPRREPGWRVAGTSRTSCVRRSRRPSAVPPHCARSRAGP